MAEFPEIALAAVGFAEALDFHQEAAAEVERCAASHTLAEARLAEAMEGQAIAEANLAAAQQTLQEAVS